MTFFITILNPLLASPLDEELKDLIVENKLISLEKVIPAPREVLRLGAMLFHETELSGTKNISCSTCHHPRFGTSDGIPFSIGQGGVGIGSFREQKTGGVTKRHSPHLINLGYKDIPNMFWDGRVEMNPSTGFFSTPEPGLNGKNPKYKEITKELKSSLSAQVIFPIVNALEMKGESGNEVANAKSNFEAWGLVVKRLLKGDKQKEYQAQFTKAFGANQKYNIGHVGEALGQFLGANFNITDTPYDRYLNGDIEALTKTEKEGLKIFLTRGKCISCHNGRHLSDFKYKSVGVPQFKSVNDNTEFDKGRFEVTGVKADQFKYRTPPLRNLALTAPFMHTGAFKSLEEVIEHYSNVKTSLEEFDLSRVDFSNYNAGFVLDKDALRNKLRINLISIGEMRRGLNLTDSEKKDLLSFLETGLLGYRFQDDRH